MATIYSAEDVAKHNTKKDLWISIHGQVYDVTSYVEDHPGGVDSLLEVAGHDATTAFEDVGHTGDARETMERYVVGKLKEEDMPPEPEKIKRQLTPVVSESSSQVLTVTGVKAFVDVLAMSVVVAAGFATMRRFGRFTTSHHWPIPSAILNLLPWAVSTSLASHFVKRITRQMFPGHVKASRPTHFKVTSKVAVQAPNHATLDPRQYVELPITSVEKLSTNSNRIIVDLPTPKAVLGLPIGQHIAIRANIDGTPVSRSYTPTSSNKDLGRLELVIKNYDTGLLTGNYLKDVQVGDKLSVCGPRGQMKYRRGLAKNIGMIAGGTGITPMFQLIRAICEDPRDQTKVVLLYGNQTEADILLRTELDKFQAEHPEQLVVHHLLSKPSAKWTGGVGRVTQDLIKESFAPGSDKDNKVMVCGPAGMVNSAKDWLVELGYERANSVSKMADQVFVF